MGGKDGGKYSSGGCTGLLPNYCLYRLQFTPNMSDVSKYSNLKAAFVDEKITAEELKDTLAEFINVHLGIALSERCTAGRLTT
jgi:hypothetical protein